MFYEDFCHTENQKNVYRKLIQLSHNNVFIAIQELDCLNIPRNEIEQILSYFEQHGLFDNVQHLSESYPVIFRLR